jgi:O-antigen/teichoic acid export membrane protein
MKIIFKNLVTNSAILSIPGLLSIFFSLISIPIHLNTVGPESYGNYIIFHFILMISINLNFGIGKSTVISINNFPKSKKKISFEALRYTKNITFIIFIIWIFIFLINKFFYNLGNYNQYISYLIFGSIITIFFITFEGILQGNRKFKSISILNLFFFSLSFSLPSVLLFYKNNLTLEDLFLISLIIKFLSVIIMFLIVKNDELIDHTKSIILFNNLKKNSKWITLNSLLIQFYDLFDKYLIKIFLGPIALASYSVPQQLTGKLSIISKSFSAYLLPNLSKKKKDDYSLNLSLQIFIKIIPLIIFCIIPFYPTILKFWLGDSFNEKILILTKIFSLSVIFSCLSHILITKFEASKTLNKNLKIELLLLPFFLVSLYILISQNYSLIHISLLILIKEILLFSLRLNFLRKEIKEINKYYLYSFLFLIILFFSFYSIELFYASLALLIISILKK